LKPVWLRGNEKEKETRLAFGGNGFLGGGNPLVEIFFDQSLIISQNAVFV